MNFRYFILAMMMLQCMTVSAQIPTRVRLKESVDIPLVIDGKAHGTITIQTGTSLPVLSAIGDTLSLDYNGSRLAVPSIKTDFADQTAVVEARKEKIQKDAETAKLADEKKLQEQEAKKPQETYENIKKSVVLMKRNIHRAVGPDVDTVKLLIDAGESYIKEYESGDLKAQLAAYEHHIQTWTKIYENKSVYGYKYNEILKKETAVPIIFNIFADTDDFYIKVGDGVFSTVASISGADLVKLHAKLIKITEWCAQCMKEGMDVQKDAGTFDGVKMEFVSKNNGDHIFIWLTVHGAPDAKHLLEEQTVRVSMLNVRALILKIGKVSELCERKEKFKRNADKLK